MIGCLRTRVRKQPIMALYFESELVLKFYNLETSPLFLSEMITKLEGTQSIAITKQITNTKPHKQWEQKTMT